jgi:hypothetical protein
MKLSLKSIFTALALVTITFVNGQDDSLRRNIDSLTKSLKALKEDMGNLKNLKITGWAQFQFQATDTNGIANFDGGQFGANSDKRFMVRRARIKFTYNGKNSQYVFQMNGTERGINLTEVFASFTDPWTKSWSLVAGVMNRPFGFEIDQSSNVRESPERSRYSQTLMPNERDCGAKIVYVAPKKSKLHGLRLDAGFYNGQGVFVPGTSYSVTQYSASNHTYIIGVNEFDYQKDFIGRLSFYRTVNEEKIKFGIGVSHYNGGIINQSNVVYDKIEKDTAGIYQWKTADSTAGTGLKGKVSKRVYTGAEAFFSIKTGLGTTTLRGEYITGIQPGTSSSTSSPFFLPTSTATYLRNFTGMYAYFIQRIGKTKHEIVVKYEWYDPNAKVTGADLLGSSKNTFTTADIKYTQLGVGYNYYMSDNVKFLVHYNIVTNEATGDGKTGINGYTTDIKGNILTVRMHYSF